MCILIADLLFRLDHNSSGKLDTSQEPTCGNTVAQGYTVPVGRSKIHLEPTVMIPFSTWGAYYYFCYPKRGNLWDMALLQDRVLICFLDQDWTTDLLSLDLSWPERPTEQIWRDSLCKGIIHSCEHNGWETQAYLSNQGRWTSIDMYSDSTVMILE